MLPITKTPFATRYIDRLNDINDQLCFGALAAAEFEAVLAPLLQCSPNAFAPTVLPNNPHVPRVHRTVMELGDFQVKSVNVACANSLIAGSEYLQSYISEIYKFVSELSGKNLSRGRNDTDEDMLLKLVKALSVSSLDSVVQTATYMRRRRNHLAHLLTEPTQEMKSFLKNDAKALDQFWKKRGLEVFGFTFTSKALSNFTFDETYGMMNLMRTSMKVIDETLAPHIPTAEIVKIAFDTVKKSSSKAGPDALIRKTKTYVTMHYGPVLDLTDIAAAAKRS